MQFFERTLDPLASRVFGKTERRSDLLEAPAFEEAQHHRRAIFRVQFVHDIVEHRPHLLPQLVGWIGAKKFVHSNHLMFAALPPVLGAADVGRHAAHTGVKPAGDGGMSDELSGVPGDVLRQGSIPPAFAKSGRMHQVDVPFDQFPEGAFGADSGVALQQFVIGIHLRS